MNTTTFAQTDREISKLAFGAMGLNCAFGNFEEKDLIRSIHHSLDQGISMIDTARAYLDSENIVGKALKEWKGENPFLASKAIPSGPAESPGWGLPNPADIAYPAGSVRKSVEESLKTLDVDVIDLMQLHQYWGNFHGEGTWLEELLQLKEEGKIRHVGISVVDHRHDGALSIVNSGLIDSVQTIINIFDPLAFDSLIPACQKNKVFVIARCVLDEGGLTGFLSPETEFDSGDFRADYFDHGPRSTYIEKVERLKKFIPEHADSLAELAIRYVLSHPGVSTACISMHIPKFADENIKAANKGPLSPEVFDELRKQHRWLHNLYQGKYFPTEDVQDENLGIGSFKAMEGVQSLDS
jgi:aryl-alcohol dehydrogenase-like predicted oxidoreductase